MQWSQFRQPDQDIWHHEAEPEAAQGHGVHYDGVSVCKGKDSEAETGDEEHNRENRHV